MKNAKLIIEGDTIDHELSRVISTVILDYRKKKQPYLNFFIIATRTEHLLTITIFDAITIKSIIKLICNDNKIVLTRVIKQIINILTTQDNKLKLIYNKDVDDSDSLYEILGSDGLLLANIDTVTNLYEDEDGVYNLEVCNHREMSIIISDEERKAFLKISEQEGRYDLLL